jgi:hypothetical protein
MRKVFLLVVVSMSVLISQKALAATVVVSPSSMDGWAFYNTDNNFTLGAGSGTYGMVTGPATPPLGTGSAHMATAAGHGDEEVQLRNGDWAGTPLSAITTLSYSTYAAAWNGQQDTFLDIYINTSGNAGGGYDDRIIFEPDYGSSDFVAGGPAPPVLDQWQTWNVLNGRFYDDNGNGGDGGANALPWSSFTALYPNAVLVNDDGNGGVGGLRITIGAVNPNQSADDYVDNFTIGTAAGATTYDFEPVPEPSSLVLGGLMTFINAAGYRWRHRRKA